MYKRAVVSALEVGLESLSDSVVTGKIMHGYEETSMQKAVFYVSLAGGNDTSQYFCIICRNLHHFRLKSGANFCA